MQQSASEHGDACVNSVQDRGSIPLASILEKAYQARPDTLFSYTGTARVFRAGATHLHFIPAHAGISYTDLPVYFIERPVSAASEGVASADAKPQARRAETEATGFRCISSGTSGSIAKSVEFEFSYHNVPTFN